MDWRESMMNLDEGVSTCEMDLQNMLIALQNRGESPQALQAVEQSGRILLAEARAHRNQLDQVMRSELGWQGNLKRWVSGQMPISSTPLPPPASAYGAPPPQGYPQQPQPQQFQPQQGFAPPPPGAQQTQMPIPPPLPSGVVDYSDPRQAAEALLRAAPMPMVPQQGAPLPPQAYPQPVPNQYVQAPPFPYPYPQHQQPMPPQQVQGMPQQQPVAGAQQAPMPTSMQFEQPTPAQQTPHQAAAAPVNGAAKA
jgi:hypothetical protein